MDLSEKIVKYKARFHHTGAMIEEMRLLIRAYNPDIPKEEWINNIIEDNLLGKNSRNWVREVIVGSFFPRFVNGKYPNAFAHIKILEKRDANFNIIKSLLYYHTALSDEFLYDFITLWLYERYFLGFSTVSAADVYNFIQSHSHEKFNKPWSDYVKRRLSRGVMATLRDFGILEGKGNKKIAHYHLPLETFVYIAFLIKQTVSSGEKLLKHSDWKLFLLNEKLTERMLLEAHQRKFLHYQAAGAVIRIEFPFQTVEELLHAIS